ncbi:uncharacterized protein B0H18DRAFT_967257 [Fomitopsis serialis]|uniref:uncharacterized protein n=1 Tax=Fomitopsis serialis TaxID=139415 RepID=UPI00200721FD|nr:uncharacterized protein B0H18DRAFT_967257 [Neoantrodia serialis]KAH9938453.1 hypothetical protein B0H18DRAFT_967257 [Neoantrodia serialis]
MAAEDEIHLELPAPASDTADASSPVENTIISPTCTNATRGDGTAVTIATGVLDSPVVEEGSSVVGFEEDEMQVDFAVESNLDEQPPPDDIGLVQGSSEYIPVALASEPTAAADDSPAFDDVAPMQVDDWTEVPAEASVEMQLDEPDLVDDNFAPTSSPLPSSSPPFMSSSPLRSSSPPYIFSSPPRAGFGSSPPSSPVPYPRGSKRKSVSFSFDDESVTQQEGTSKAAQKKRALWDVDSSDDTTFNEIADASSPGLREIESKRVKLDPDMPYTSSATLPQPKRQTLASQLRQRQKLVAPFRSPLVDKDAARHGVDAVYASGKNRAGLVTKKRDADMQVDDRSASMQAAQERVGAVSLQPQATKDYTPKVAKQFKSPLHLGSSSSSSQPTTAVSSVQAVPTIRALQAQIQTLKQAIKIKTSGGGNDEDELEELVVKWTTVGREVAWAVWDTVKDLDPGEAANMGKDGRRDGGRGGGWGFDDSSNQPQNGGVGEEEEGGSKDDDEEPHFSTLLTLGWDEEEGDLWTSTETVAMNLCLVETDAVL